MFGSGMYAFITLFDTLLKRLAGMTLFGNGWPLVGSVIALANWEKSPARIFWLGMLLNTKKPSGMVWWNHAAKKNVRSLIMRPPCSASNSCRIYGVFRWSKNRRAF